MSDSSLDPVSRLEKVLGERRNGLREIAAKPTKYEEGLQDGIDIALRGIRSMRREIETYIKSEIESQLPDAVQAHLENLRESRYED